MNPVPKDEIDRLLAENGSPCISIYMPTYRGARDTKQNAIRFRNMVRRADEALVQLGLGDEARDELLAPLRELEGDHDFWQHQDDGLAVFRSERTFFHFEVPSTLEELCVVEDRFHLKPLLSFHSLSSQYFLIELAMHSVKMFEGDAFELRPVDLGDAPKRLEEAVGWDVEPKQLQYHSARSASHAAGVGPVGAGASDAVYHGQGGGTDDRKTEVRKWFTILRDAIAQRIPDRQTPVVLAGVEWMCSYFREAADLKMMDEIVRGNAEPLSAKELHERAWPIVEKHVAQELDTASERFTSMAAHGKGSSDIEEVLVAAVDGRVQTLYVSRDDHVWGEYDNASRSVTLFDAQRPGADDLLDRAAVETYAKGGRVFVVPPEKLPNGGKLSAVYRY